MVAIDRKALLLEANSQNFSDNQKNMDIQGKYWIETQILVVRQTLDRQTLDTTNPGQTNNGHNKQRT